MPGMARGRVLESSKRTSIGLPPATCHSETSFISSPKAALWNRAGTAFRMLPQGYPWRRLRDYARRCSTDDTKRLNTKGFGCRGGLHIDMMFVIVALRARFCEVGEPRNAGHGRWDG